MEFKEVDIEGEENVSDSHPLKDFALYIVGILLIILVTVTSINYSLSYMIPKISDQHEKKMYSLVSNIFPKKEALIDQEETERARKIYQKLISGTKFEDYNLNVVVLNDKQTNAFAHPNGSIYLLKGIVKTCENDTQLALVIGHELGHFKNRDHLRGLGIGIFYLVVQVVTGIQSSAADSLIGTMFEQVSNRFGRHQEHAADSYGLELVRKHYSVDEDTLTIFEKISKQSKVASYFSTHPYGGQRTENLKKQLLKK